MTYDSPLADAIRKRQAKQARKARTRAKRKEWKVAELRAICRTQQDFDTIMQIRKESRDARR